VNIELRDYEPASDFDDVFVIAREIISLPPFDEARRELQAYPDRELIAKVSLGADGSITGFCAATFPYWDNIAIIDYLVVAPSERRQGVGQHLVQAVESDLKEMNARIISVQTATWNDEGIRFYETLGYQQRAVFDAYFGEGNDLVWLDRVLL